MNYVKEEISKENFEAWKDLKGKELEEKFNIPIAWYCGYGYYGCSLTYDANADKYYAVHTIGSTCD